MQLWFSHGLGPKGDMANRIAMHSTDGHHMDTLADGHFTPHDAASGTTAADN
jgi:hypothetical protein